MLSHATLLTSLLSIWETGELSCIPAAEWDDEDAIDTAVQSMNVQTRALRGVRFLIEL